jgi:hypothetical protein
VTTEQRQAEAVRVLVALSALGAHGQLCPATPRIHRDPSECDCWVIRDCRIQAKALDDAGLLCALVEPESGFDEFTSHEATL